MTLQKQVLIWAISLAVLVFGLWLFSPILLPFIAGLVLAYFLDPVADALQRLGLSRLAAALLIVIVAAFESVGAILVIAMLILPGATAQLLSTRLPICLVLSVLHAAVSAIGGLHLSLILGCPMAAAVVVAAADLVQPVQQLFAVHES